MTTTPFDFEQLVRLEVEPQQKLTTQQLAVLACDKERWMNTLNVLMKSVDAEVLAKQVEALRCKFKASSKKELQEFERWRSEQMRLKALLGYKLKQVKSHIDDEKSRIKATLEDMTRQFWSALEEARDLVPFEDGPGLDWHIRVSVLLKRSPLEAAAF